MILNKINDSISKKVFTGDLIKCFLNGKIPIRLLFFAYIISIKKRILLYRKRGFKGLKNIEGLNKYNIPKKAFDSKTKKEGFSGIARLKNGDDFLKTCLENMIGLLDEIILLVDINSTDRTIEICKKLHKKNPKFFKYYEYEPEVYPGRHIKYSSTPDNSVHALSYFYNYSLSKVNYKYVMKFDDDMLVIPKEFIDNKNYFKSCNKNIFLAIPQINISQNTRKKYIIRSKYLGSGISGAFGDHGFFPISTKTYFFNDVGCENLLMPFSIKYGKVSFLHLKNLKKTDKNYSSGAQEYSKDLFQDNYEIKLPTKYYNILKNKL